MGNSGTVNEFVGLGDMAMYRAAMDPNKSNIGTDEPAAEVELSAQDLLALSAPSAVEKRDHGVTPSAAGPQTKEAVSPRTRPAQPLHKHAVALSPLRRVFASRVAVSLSVFMAVVTAGGALYVSVTSDRPEPTSSTTVLRVAEWETAAATPEPEGEPVRFANPFDEKEVFEFPPGTSESEAHDAVADLLMKRAMERQAQR